MKERNHFIDKFFDEQTDDFLYGLLRFNTAKHSYSSHRAHIVRRILQMILKRYPDDYLTRFPEILPAIEKFLIFQNDCGIPKKKE